MALAGLVILTILAVSRFFRGFVGQIAVLISSVVGTVVACFMGLVDFGNVSDAKWLGLPHIFHFGHPKFAAAAIITIC